VAELEHGLLARAQLPDVAVGADPDGTAHPLGLDGQGQLTAGQCHLDRGFPKLHRERQAVKLAREPRIEVQDAVADEAAGVAALHEVERAGHDTQMNAFLGRAALDVIGIAVQRDQEPLPRALWIDGGQHPGMGDKAQRRAVRGAPVIVRDVPLHRIGMQGVPEPLEDLAEFGVPEQEEQHHRVGLFGDLVPVGVLAFGAQDPV